MLKYAMDAERIQMYVIFEITVCAEFLPDFQKMTFSCLVWRQYRVLKDFSFLTQNLLTAKGFCETSQIRGGSRKNSCKIGYTCYLFNCRFSFFIFNCHDSFRFIKEFNVIEMGKMVDLVPISKRLGPWFFFNLSTMQPINRLNVFYLCRRIRP